MGSTAVLDLGSRGLFSGAVNDALRVFVQFTEGCSFPEPACKGNDLERFATNMCGTGSDDKVRQRI